MANPEATIDLLTSSFDLVRGRIDNEAWLKSFAAAADADASACVRWTCGIPERVISSTYGETNYLPAGWCNWADHILNQANVSASGLLDEFATSLNRPALLEANPVADPQLLIGVSDWSPAYICMIAYRDPAKGPWSEDERNSFKRLCELTRQSIKLHKDVARTQNIASATADILNSSPRGIVAMSIDGSIQFANSLAIKLLGLNDGMSSKDGKLRIQDPNAREKLAEFINTTKALKPEQLHMKNPEALRNFNVKRPSNSSAFQILASSIPLSSWTIESSPSDRMILVYIHDPQKPMLPSAKQLRDYYDLTKAQARIAVHLCSSDNIIGAAESAGISVNTARSHLRVIYRKTGAKTQQELAKMLTSTLKTYDDSVTDQ